MANPNIVNVSTISGKTNAVVANTATTLVVKNPLSSGKILKMNALSLANKSTGVEECDVIFNDESQSNATFFIAKSLDIPAESTVFAIDKSSSYYLEEGDSITVTASALSAIDVIASYEEIS